MTSIIFKSLDPPRRFINNMHFRACAVGSQLSKHWDQQVFREVKHSYHRKLYSILKEGVVLCPFFFSAYIG